MPGRRRAKKVLDGQGQARGRAPREGLARRIGISVTEAEYRTLEAAAKKEGVSLAAYCRRLVLLGL